MALGALLLGGAGCLPSVGRKELPPPPVTPVACTLEARLCPDGTYVGRVPPDCEFAPCPGREQSCKDQCGNGTCEEIVCLAIGCPCAESEATCPQDCGR